MKISRNTLGLLLAGFLFLACEDEKSLNKNVLSDFLILEGTDTTLNLISCAGGKEGGIMPGDQYENSIFFYPLPGASHFKCFVSNEGPDNLASFELMELPLDSLFHGYMMRYLAGSELNHSWVRVCYSTSEGIHLSNAITMKTDVKPSQISNEIRFEPGNGTGQVKVSWQDGIYHDNEIYFEVFADTLNNFMSGTYTYEKVFYYYHLDNVVLNVTRETPPELVSGNRYMTMIMGVSIYNWVNNIWQSFFIF